MRYLSGTAVLALDESRCTGCGICIEVCPRNVFTLEARKAVITDMDLCMECGACALNCPPNAISAGSGVGCAAAIINGMIRGAEPECGCSADAASGSCSSGC